MPVIPDTEIEETPESINPKAVFEAYGKALQEFPDQKEFLETQLDKFKGPLRALSRLYDNLSDLLEQEGKSRVTSVSDLLALDTEGPNAGIRNMALTAIGEMWEKGVPVFGISTFTSDTETVGRMIKLFNDELLPGEKITPGKKEGKIGGIQATYGSYGGGVRLVLHPDPFQQVQLVNELIAPEEKPFESNVAALLKGLAVHGTPNEQSAQKTIQFLEESKQL